jgi:D-amino peptidase
MKIYISADIEGVTGIGHWDETDKSTPNEYEPLRQQMTAEVNAACEAALEMGATEILIKDAHDSGRNLILENLPEVVKLVRGWAGHPLSMIQELDESFDAAFFIGYHSRAGSGGNPLAHTMSSRSLSSVNINGQDISEFYLHAMMASTLGVPVVLVSGDAGLCDEVRERNGAITTVAVIEGIGNSVVSIHPQKALKMIREGVRKALSGDLKRCLLPEAESYRMELRFKRHQDAYRSSFYPGAHKVDDHTTAFEHKDYFELMRFIMLAF